MRFSSTTRSRLASSTYWSLLALGATVLGWFSTGMHVRGLAVPVSYRGDGIFTAQMFRSTLDFGWYERNPDLNAPFGQNVHDFPQADNFQYLIAVALDTVTDDWAVAYNTVYLLSFPLAALSGTWFLRTVGVSRAFAWVLGVLFAFAPYHFTHGSPHLGLSLYFVVPLGVAIAYWALVGTPLWSRPAALPPRSLISRPDPWPTLRTALFCLVLGTTASYYAIFVLILLAATVVALSVRRAWSAATGVLVAMGAIVTTVLANMAPDLWHSFRHPDDVVAFGRLPQETEGYALKLSSLVLPTHWNPLGDLGTWRVHLDSIFPLPGEPTFLGVVGAVGFVALLLIPLIWLSRLSGRPAEDPRVLDTEGRGIAALSLLNLVCFLTATIGGLSTLIAVLATPTIRAWSRFAIIIALLSLACVGILLDRLVRVVERRQPRVRPAFSTAVAACVLVLGLVDQVPPPSWIDADSSNENFAVDADFVAAIERTPAKGGAVLHIPFMNFPENGPILDIDDYDPLRLYLHSRHLRWTFGGWRGNIESSWTQRLETDGARRLLVSASAAGMSGISIDRFGFAAHDASELERPLAKVLKTEPVTSSDGRFAFYDLTAFNKRIANLTTREERAELGRRITRSPGFAWPISDWAPPADEAGLVVARSGLSSSSLRVGNPQRGPVKALISMVVRAEVPGEHELRFTWPDGTSTVRTVGVEGFEISRKTVLAPGNSTIRIRGAGPITVISPSISDPQASIQVSALVRELNRR